MTSPPTFDRQLLRRLADLARLHVAADRQADLQGRLEKIVAAFAALRDLPPLRDGSEPDAEPGVTLRPDLAEPPMAPADVLANAPRHAGGAFVVPRVVEA